MIILWIALFLAITPIINSVWQNNEQNWQNYRNQNNFVLPSTLR